MTGTSPDVDERTGATAVPETYAGEPATYVCRICGSGALRSIETVPRSIALREIKPDPAVPGGLLYGFDPESHDETYWEGSETIGFECGDCLAGSRRLELLAVPVAEHAPGIPHDLGPEPGVYADLRAVQALLWPAPGEPEASPEELCRLIGAILGEAGLGRDDR